MKLLKMSVMIVGLACAQVTLADSPLVYVKQVPGNFDKTYKNVFTTLEDNGYYVIFEPNISKNLANLKDRWGKEYNKNKLEAIRSMIFCSASYANEISNLDPQLLALCPLHITLTHKEGVTQILFVRPSLIASGSPAEKIAAELEQDVIRTIESAVKGVVVAPTATPVPETSP
jgi:uncharacterized protein (DUF302 family)